MATGKEVLQLQGHTSPVNSVSFNSAGTHIVSVSRDKTVRVWDIQDGTASHCFKADACESIDGISEDLSAAVQAAICQMAAFRDEPTRVLSVQSPDGRYTAIVQPDSHAISIVTSPCAVPVPWGPVRSAHRPDPPGGWHMSLLEDGFMVLPPQKGEEEGSVLGRPYFGAVGNQWWYWLDAAAGEGKAYVFAVHHGRTTLLVYDLRRTRR